MLDLEGVNRELMQLNEELEERVRLRTRELEDKVTELNAFTSAVSHDLRTPMRQLRSYSQILMENLEDRLDEENAQILLKIDQKSTAAMEMVDTLLELSRLGKAEVVREEIDLARMAEDIIKELSAAEPDRHYRFDASAGLMAEADRQLMQIVMTNLLGNAWKYTANRQEARISLTAAPADGATVYCVGDNGAGFDMQNVHKLFIPFQRLHGQEEFSGVGIGLTTVNSIIRSHGGRIWAESEPDKGARFCFTLGNNQ
jgi:light-regulated signal transduction histidine kinase (bacteriophytochrome)